MAVMMPREKWTDERLDDLNKKVDDGFAQTHAEISGVRDELNHQVTGLRTEMNDRFEAVRTEMNARFEAVNARFDALNRNLIVAAVAIIAALIGTNSF